MCTAIILQSESCLSPMHHLSTRQFIPSNWSSRFQPQPRRLHSHCLVTITRSRLREKQTLLWTVNQNRFSQKTSKLPERIPEMVLGWRWRILGRSSLFAMQNASWITNFFKWNYKWEGEGNSSYAGSNWECWGLEPAWLTVGSRKLGFNQIGEHFSVSLLFFEPTVQEESSPSNFPRKANL
jgi:hypothetical protein